MESIKKAGLLTRPATDADLPALCALSRALVDEGCCNGMVYDTLEDWRSYQNIIVAEQDGQLVGYSYGRIATSRIRVPGCNKGDSFYDLEELYVLPALRSAGVGRQLFAAQEQLARSLYCKTLQLAAVSRDHGRLLRFYEQMGMNFWSAWMIKELD